MVKLSTAGYHEYDTTMPHSIECHHDNDDQNLAHEKKRIHMPGYDHLTLIMKCVTKVDDPTEQNPILALKKTVIP